MQTLPPLLTASSGSMLVLLYSDTNYVMSGLSASFTASPCPASCSGHGECDALTGRCACEPTHSGPDCSLALCPASCGASAGWGWCRAQAGGYRQIWIFCQKF